MYFSNDDISLVLHRLNEVLDHAKALQDFLDMPQWQAFAHTQAYIDFMHAKPAHIHEFY
jgi:hypothetical protein